VERERAAGSARMREVCERYEQQMAAQRLRCAPAGLCWAGRGNQEAHLQLQTGQHGWRRAVCRGRVGCGKDTLSPNSSSIVVVG
jgi:hypothetical protein